MSNEERTEEGMSKGYSSSIMSCIQRHSENCSGLHPRGSQSLSKLTHSWLTSLLMTGQVQGLVGIVNGLPRLGLAFTHASLLDNIKYHLIWLTLSNLINIGELVLH